MSDQGERGDSGQRGVQGERGPKGDHGQMGDTGLTGPAGKVVHDEKRERHRDRKALFAAATLLALPVAIVALIPAVYGMVRISNEVDRNCRVAIENRAALRDIIEDAAQRTATSKQRTAEEKKEAAMFYARSLKRLDPNPC